MDDLANLLAKLEIVKSILISLKTQETKTRLDVETLEQYAI